MYNNTYSIGRNDNNTWFIENDGRLVETRGTRNMQEKEIRLIVYFQLTRGSDSYF